MSASLNVLLPAMDAIEKSFSVIAWIFVEMTIWQNSLVLCDPEGCHVLCQLPITILGFVIFWPAEIFFLAETIKDKEINQYLLHI